MRKPGLTATIERVRLLSLPDKITLRDELEDMIDKDVAQRVKELREELESVGKEMISEAKNMDCMEYMAGFADKFFELAIVDPPYGLGLDMITKVDSNARQKRNNRTVVNNEHKSWNNEIPGPDYFKELHRVSKNQIIWGCNYYAKYIPAVGRIIHDKIMGTEETEFNWSHADLASCSLQKRITIFRYQWAGNKQNGTINWKNIGSDSRIHPTQKPIALYAWLLKNYATKGDKILDTHLGSGSSRIAAYKLGFDFYSCEIDKDYFDAQEKRFADAINEPLLKEIEKAKQSSLYDR